MSAIYCDSNFWVRLFVEFPDSDRARAELEGERAGSDAVVPLTWLHRLEVTNAFNRLAFQARSGAWPHLTREQAAIAVETFRDLAAGRGFAINQPLASEHLEPQFVSLSERHTIKH